MHSYRCCILEIMCCSLCSSCILHIRLINKICQSMPNTGCRHLVHLDIGCWYPVYRYWMSTSDMHLIFFNYNKYQMWTPGMYVSGMLSSGVIRKRMSCLLWTRCWLPVNMLVGCRYPIFSNCLADFASGVLIPRHEHLVIKLYSMICHNGASLDHYSYGCCYSFLCWGVTMNWWFFNGFLTMTVTSEKQPLLDVLIPMY